MDQTTAQPIATGPDFKDRPVVSPDGTWILYLSHPDGSTPERIMRVPTSGGAPQLVLEGRGVNELACVRSPAPSCLFSQEAPDRKQLIFSEFDPIKGRGQELTRVGLNQPVVGYSWAVSPDGSRLAFAQFDEAEGRIQILALAGGQTREINVKDWKGLQVSAWAADGRGLFVSPAAGQGVTLLYVDLEGHAQITWRQEWSGVNGGAYGVPSPDGRHLAVSAQTEYHNVWLLENF